MPTENVVAIQLILYGLSWLVAAILMPEERKCLANWAAYALLQGLSGFMLAAGLNFGSFLLTMTFVLNTLGFYAVVRGIEAFATDTQRLDRWLLAPVLITLLILLLIPLLITDITQLRYIQVVMYSLMVVILLLGTAPYLWIQLRKHHNKALSLIGLTPGVLMGIIALVQLVMFVFDIRFSPEHAKKINGENLLSSMIATGIFNLAYIFLFITRVVKRLHDSAKYDYLTGALNRGESDARLQRAWQRHQRNTSIFSVALLDIDKFKNINDTRGHSFGDDCIKLTARAIKAEIRAYDSAGRWGGEEFVLIMPGCNLLQAEILCNRLREKLPELARNELNIEFTASIGIASVALTDTSPEQLIARADAALYRAKAEGRNRVVCDV